MIVEHADMLEQSETNIALLLDSAHDTLLSDKQVSVIERAMRDVLQREIRLTITPGSVSRETPAARKERLRQESLAAAEQALKTDATVSSLLSEFDGRLDDVLPLEKNVAADVRHNQETGR
jgi:hypothetical protein